MRISRWAGVVCALVLATGAGPAAQQEDPALEALLTRATWYALDFVDKLSSVVAEERYVQDSSVALPTVPIPGLGGRGGGFSSPPRGSAKHRELKSDFLIVKSAGELWEPFRDVYEVDHIPVRDREERVTKLFLHPTGDTQARAKAIADESGRYNLGAVRRTINNPVFALIFLQPELRWHFKFTFGKPDRRMGDDVRVVEFVEEARPTVIIGLARSGHGRVWTILDRGGHGTGGQDRGKSRRTRHQGDADDGVPRRRAARHGRARRRCTKTTSSRTAT